MSSKQRHFQIRVNTAAKQHIQTEQEEDLM